MQPWQERRQALCPASAAASDRGGIASTLHPTTPKHSAHCNSCARRSTRWTTIICKSCSPALTITGIRRCGIGGKRGGGSTGVGQTQSRGCVCCADWRKTLTGSGLQQPGNPLCSYSRRCSTYPSTLPRLESKARKCLSHRVCKRWDTPRFLVVDRFVDSRCQSHLSSAWWRSILNEKRRIETRDLRTGEGSLTV